MAYLFRRHDILPSRYYAMEPGEKLLLAALAEAELEDEA